MRMKYTLPLILSLTALFAAACAKTDTTSPNADEKAFLEAWLPLHYPDAVKSGKGIYIVEDLPGDGPVWDSEKPYTQVDYIIRNLSNTVSASTTEAMARQLGTYNSLHFYGPRYVSTGKDLSYAGVDEILKGMRAGGTRTAIIPAWMMSYERYDTEEEYLAESSSAGTSIYTITFYGQTEDVIKDQYQELKAYATRLWQVADTLESGIFFRSFQNADQESVAKDTTVYINYTGRLLNGKVFDTTIADTAKVHHIYTAGKSYAPIAVSMAPEVANIKMGGSAPVTGFQKGLFLLHAHEKASFAFSSVYGYGASGKNPVLPGYAPLHFDVELVDKPQ